MSFSDQSLIIVFTHSLQDERWDTSAYRHWGEGVKKWRSSIAAWSVVECTEAEANVQEQEQELKRVLHAITESNTARVFAVGNTPTQMAFFTRLKTQLPATCELIVIALRGKTVNENEQLETAGAHFVVSHLCEVTSLITTPAIRASLSVLLLAYNEAAVLEKAVNDVHRFCQWYAPDYEIVIINDGSTDTTAAVAAQLSDANSHVRVITHARNLGMGASMRDGYEAASKSYVVSLPGDRQVKAHSLAAFLPHLAENTVVLSRYPVPHSGRARAVMSSAFRILLQQIGDLRVDVAGAYLFSTPLFRRAGVPRQVASDTFLYSFQLLDSFKKQGAAFYVVDVWPFPREVGQSREARMGRIVKMAGEIAKHRVRSKVYRLFLS